MSPDEIAGTDSERSFILIQWIWYVPFTRYYSKECLRRIKQKERFGEAGKSLGLALVTTSFRYFWLKSWDTCGSYTVAKQNYNNKSDSYSIKPCCEVKR